MKAYDYHKMRGVCVRCLKNQAAPGRVRCEECLAKNAEAQARYRERHGEDKEKKRERQRKLRQERMEAGLCVACGRHKQWNGKTLCMSCAMKDRARQERYRMKHPYEPKETQEERKERLKRQAALMTEKSREGNREWMDGHWRLVHAKHAAGVNTWRAATSGGAGLESIGGG